MASKASTFTTPAKRLDTFFDPAQPRAAFEDVEIDEVASLLQQCGQEFAARCPRMYIVLRTINQLDLLEQMLSAGFGDEWFPVGERGQGLPHFLDPQIKARIGECQRIVLTKSVDLEHGRHRHFALGEPLPFNIGDRLGSGGYGQVDKIVSRISYKEYALKRIHRRTAFGNNSKEAVADIVREIAIIKTLAHRHIVKYIGSYTDPRHFGLIIAPVADCDLASYMQQTCVDRGKCSTLRMFFGCLATALSYLHENSIRHRDIKPQNVLIYQSNLLITDFGLSRDYPDTTSGPTQASKRYCSPEVASLEARNMSSDIWSLGCVFMEMVAAMQGYDVDWLRRRFENVGTKLTHYHANPLATEELLEHWAVSLERNETMPLVWIREMLLIDRTARPTAAHIVEMITCLDDSDYSATTFCGICCAVDDQGDSVGSLMDITNDESENHNQAAELQNEPQVVSESEMAVHVEGLPTTQAVFGVSVDTSIRYAQAKITTFHRLFRSDQNIEGHIPIIIKQCCDYIMQKGHLFCKPLSSFKDADKAKVEELQAIFDTPPSYGSDLDWKKYSSSEAKAILYAYLHSLPEPLISPTVAQQLASMISDLDGDWRFDSISETYAFSEALCELSRPRYFLLLYLFQMFHEYSIIYTVLGSHKSVAKMYHSCIFDLEVQENRKDAKAIDLVRFLIEYASDFVDIEGKRQRRKKHTR